MNEKRRTTVRSVIEIELRSNLDDRGALTAIEGGIDIPFDIARCYFMHDVVAARGGHAHRLSQQIVVAVSGSSRIRLSDGVATDEILLSSPTSGVYIGPMTWIELPFCSPGAVVLVFASTHYDNSKVIRDWNEYLRERSATEPSVSQRSEP